MSDENHTQEVPEPERYSVEYVELSSELEGNTVAALQEVLNTGTRKSWRLVGVAPDPAGGGVLVIWDLEGFISG